LTLLSALGVAASFSSCSTESTEVESSNGRRRQLGSVNLRSRFAVSPAAAMLSPDTPIDLPCPANDAARTMHTNL